MEEPSGTSAAPAARAPYRREARVIVALALAAALALLLVEFLLGR